MAAAAILDFEISLRCQVFCLRNLWRHLLAKFGLNRTIGNEMAPYYVKSKMAAAAILDFD
jgi:hypothetical protein